MASSGVNPYKCYRHLASVAADVQVLLSVCAGSGQGSPLCVWNILLYPCQEGHMLDPFFPMNVVI